MLSRTFYGLGRILRETGQALDRLGCQLQGNNAFREQLSRHRRLVPLYNMRPQIGTYTFVAPNATVVGGAEIGKGSAVWYGAVIRSDVNKVKIGDGASIGDRVVVHVTRDAPSQTGHGTYVGHNVTVGPGAILHGCTLEDGATVEAGACVMDGVVVGTHAVVGAGSTVLIGTRIPPDQLWAGSPAKFVRDLTEEEKTKNAAQNRAFLELAEKHDYWHSLTPEERGKLSDEAFVSKPPAADWKPEALF